jgi:4-aminobutyrate aminotransferase / (S)-3-amino-2-methylpropionate transaminase / 5-aminovalerate transaminase
MGPRPAAEVAAITADVPPGTIVFSTAFGSNVIDVDGNRYVDLAQGFGAGLVGHRHRNIQRVVELQTARLHHALGDVYPADAKIGLMERLLELYPRPARVILGQSGADAVSAALKTAALHTKKPGVIAFEGAYHGLSYGPLAACGFRESYRRPFAEQLNQHVAFVAYPSSAESAQTSLRAVEAALSGGGIGAILMEPVLGRAGVILPPDGFSSRLLELAEEHGAVLVADEVWTGLGRSGAWLRTLELGAVPHLICLGKGLGGGLPISACLGDARVMNAWSQADEVVHTSTFAGAPLACATALAVLDVLKRQALPERARELGACWLEDLERAVASHALVTAIRGAGLMIGIELSPRFAGGAQLLQRILLERGYITTTGGGGREALVLTPALNIDPQLLEAFTQVLASVFHSMGS